MNAHAIPLSLYVHLPWCVKKCPYCDFNSFAAGDSAEYDRYLDALINDLVREAGRDRERELISIFVGGGTPSLFSPGHIAKLLDAVAAEFRLADDIEVTMEANPGSVESGDPAGYRQAGVNRLSIGAQSFDPASLETLGRIHSVSDARRSVCAAREAGVDNINVDIMHALPRQSVEAALADIEAAAELQPAHISWYQLTLEPNTVFHARPPEGLPDEDAVAVIQARGRERLAELGYGRYEVSAYARPGMQSAHNLNYWSFGDYLAIGAGAHGKITAGDGIWRYAKPGHPRQYMEAMEDEDFESPLTPVEAGDRLFEFMLNACRLTGGFSEDMFSERTGLGANALHPRLDTAAAKGLIVEKEAGYWQPTALGARFLNNLQAEFLPE